MASVRRKLVAGNWKMNGLHATGLNLAREIAHRARQASRLADEQHLPKILVCPPATLLFSLAESLAGSPVLLGAQDCRAEKSGAFTGDISATMLKDAGCSHVILGHSERRALHHETSADVCTKAMSALAQGLVAIICVGETEAERDADAAFDVVGDQLRQSLPGGAGVDRIVIAYEPIWAIGTGRTPTAEQIADMHRHIAGVAPNIQILYGGSVKAENAAEMMAVDRVDGALVGGASLDPISFWTIVEAAV